MTVAKRKVSVSLDSDLVDALEAGSSALSKQVNDAVRESLARRERQRQLRKLLTQLDERHGRVSERLVAKYEALLA